VGTDGASLRALVNERLALITNPEFELYEPHYAAAGIKPWENITKSLAELQQEKGSFLESHGYDWVLDRASYNSEFEAILQWRLLNVLADISSDHPALKRCDNLIVRIIPTSSARPHLREIDKYRVIILTTGYLMVFKGFLRLWLRGCAIGEKETKQKPTNYREYAVNYKAAIQKAEDKMALSAEAYLGTLVQLLENQVPGFGNESIFDEQLLKREQWEVLFAMTVNAIDGFLLFHETAHVLAGDSAGAERTIKKELEADRGSVSLCIIDEARHGGFGTVHLGGPMFFCVELLRLLFEEILEFKAGRHDPSSGRYPGINELMLRSNRYGEHVQRFLGPLMHSPYIEWSSAIAPAFDTVRWALLHHFDPKVSLAEFVARRDSESIDRT